MVLAIVFILTTNVLLGVAYIFVHRLDEAEKRKRSEELRRSALFEKNSDEEKGCPDSVCSTIINTDGSVEITQVAPSCNVCNVEMEEIATAKCIEEEVGIRLSIRGSKNFYSAVPSLE